MDHFNDTTSHQSSDQPGQIAPRLLRTSAFGNFAGRSRSQADHNRGYSPPIPGLKTFLASCNMMGATLNPAPECLRSHCPDSSESDRGGRPQELRIQFARRLERAETWDDDVESLSNAHRAISISRSNDVTNATGKGIVISPLADERSFLSVSAFVAWATFRCCRVPPLSSIALRWSGLTRSLRRKIKGGLCTRREEILYLGLYQQSSYRVVKSVPFVRAQLAPGSPGHVGDRSQDL